MDFQPPEPVDHQKTVPIKLRDIKFPEEQRPSGSRLGGRLARGGEPLPSQLSVRDKVKALNELYKNKPKPSVREELKNLRKKQAHTPTHSVGAADYAPASTPSDEPVTTVVRRPDMRLLKIPPEFELEMFPEELTVGELYTKTLPYLDGEPDPRTGLRGGPVAAMASQPPPPPRSASATNLPSATSWQRSLPLHPDFECQDQNEDPEFHRTVSAFSLVTDGFWKNKKGIAKDKEMQDLLKEVKELKVRTLRQMVYLEFATRLRSNHKDRTPNALRFIHAVLTARDPRRDLPTLLRKHQPRFTDRLTTNAWPTEIDFRRALDHWSCYCVHAAIYIMNHLSGPIIWGPDWFQEPGFPVEVYKTFRMDIVDDGVNILHDLRQQFYRQYGIEHIKAIAENRREFVWRRFDDDEEIRVPLGLEFDQPITVFVDQDTWNLYRYGLREGVEFILIDTTNMSSALHDVRQYFPGKNAKKVVFWFGLEYLHQDNCYGLALAVLCYHYTRFLGRIEQYAVMPPYIRSKRQLWASSVLGTFHQRQQIMPHARIATTPLDLRAWERDERELQQTGRLRTWDTTAMDEDGHLLTDALINAVKSNLELNHGLDLWNAETGPSMMKLSRELSLHENAVPGQRHTSSAHGPFPKTASLAAQMPSTSGTGTGTHSVPNLDLDQVAAALAKRLPGTNITREQLAEALASATSFVADRANTILDERRSHSRKDKDIEPRK